jgi:alpha-tubulin suppressor-like RCC1 family protein
MLSNTHRHIGPSIAFAFALACAGDDGAGTPSACVGGQFCPENLVCVDGFCVAAGDEVGTDGVDGTSENGDDVDGTSTGDGDGDARTVAMVASGSTHSCVLFDDGGVRCWGHNDRGQLGYGHTDDIGDQPGEMPPPDVDVGGLVVDLDVGHSHTCALLDNGEVRCWGNNYSGQLGIGSTENIGDQPGEMPPSPVDLQGAVAHLDAGTNHNCVLLMDGGVRCWGRGEKGTLGNGSTGDFGSEPDETQPPLIDVGGPVVEFALGTVHSCARIQNGQVRCWGAAGQTGYGLVDDSTVPGGNVALGSSPATHIAAGHQHTCAVFEDGTVRCWGRGSFGQLGTGNTEDIGDVPGEMPPAPVAVGVDVLGITATEFFSCVTHAAGVRCWGTNIYAMLGIPFGSGNDHVGDEPGEMPPDDLVLGAGPVSLARLGAASKYACAVTEGKDVRCWGSNEYGELGGGNLETIGDQAGEMPPPVVPVL